jgi:hypothetical protein
MKFRSSVKRTKDDAEKIVEQLNRFSSELERPFKAVAVPSPNGGEGDFEVRLDYHDGKGGPQYFVDWHQGSSTLFASSD